MDTFKALKVTFFLLCYHQQMAYVSGKWYTRDDTDYFLSAYTSEAWYSWSEARQNCLNEGAEMASIHSAEEMDLLMELSEDEYWYSDPYWLGFNNLKRNGYEWIDGSTVNYTNWASGWPLEDDYGEYCAYTMPRSDGSWFNGHCGLDKGYICMRPAGVIPSTVITPTTTPAPGYCPAGYTDAGNKCFKLITVAAAELGATFEEALARCRSMTTFGVRPDIASIHSGFENALITSLMEQHQTVDLWIGLTQIMNSEWLWVDNQDSDYFNWASKMPDKYSGDCTTIVYRHPPVGHTGTWENSDCDFKRGYVCQVEKDSSSWISTPPSTTTNVCQEGYMPYANSCYKLFEQAMNWTAANTTCTQDGATLVSIFSEPENSAIVAMRSHLAGDGKVWIGLIDDDADDVYHWTVGWYILYTKWQYYEPDRKEGGGCVAMSADGSWSDEVCGEPRPFICKTTRVPALTTPAHVEGKCPKALGWIPYGDNCYKFEDNDRGSWMRAQEKCYEKHEHAQLISIHDVVENDWAFKIMIAKEPWSDIWLGMYRGKDKEYHWADGTAVQYSHWAPGSPNPDLGDSACVVMKMKESPKLWAEEACHYNLGYICKTPKRDLPTPPPDVPGTCPDGWTPYGADCYWFEPDSFNSWQAAEAWCQKSGGSQSHLAWVDGEHENDFIHEEMKRKNNLPHTRDYWLGGRKHGKVGPYYWTNGGNMTFQHWNQDYPTSDPNEILNCVEVEFDSGTWKNTGCDSLRGIVCKLPKTTSTGSTTITPNITTGTPTTEVTTVHVQTQSNGIEGGGIAAIILSLLLILSIVVNVLYVLRARGMGPVLRSFDNPVADPMSPSVQDYGESSVGFRHGSTMSKDQVTIDHDDHTDA